MELVHIKDLVCPQCNAEMRSETREDQHCNGHYNERRKFKCGFSLWFSPNFMKVVETAECQMTEAYLQKIYARKNAIYKLFCLITDLPVDDKFKDHARQQIKDFVRHDV